MMNGMLLVVVRWCCVRLFVDGGTDLLLVLMMMLGFDVVIA